jgi:hypothetical protein
VQNQPDRFIDLYDTDFSVLAVTHEKKTIKQSNTSSLSTLIVMNEIDYTLFFKPIPLAV